MGVMKNLDIMRQEKTFRVSEDKWEFCCSTCKQWFPLDFSSAHDDVIYNWICGTQTPQCNNCLRKEALKEV